MIARVKYPGFTCVIVALLLAASAAASQRTIVAFGDSTTAARQGVTVYAALLESALAGASVINAGVPGDTTAESARRFEKDVLARKPDLVIIQFGINDAMVDVWKRPPATAPRVAPEAYRRNLDAFVSALRRGGARVILMTPNPLRWTPALKKRYGRKPYDPDDADGLNVVLSRYAAIVRGVARDHSVPVVDVYGAFAKHGSQAGRSVDDLLLDGMHPGSEGHRIIADLLLHAAETAGRKESDE